MAVAIKEFLWAGNGHTVETLKPGDERDFGAHEVGLTVAGLIISESATADAADEPALAAEPEPAVEQAPTRRRKA